MSKFLTVTHGGHKIHNMNVCETESDALQYVSDYIYNNLNDDDKKLAHNAKSPLNVSIIVSGSPTPNVFKWYTDKLTDEKSTFYEDEGCGSNVVSFIVEIPDEMKFFIFPMGYSENSDVRTIENVDYSNYTFVGDFVTAQSSADYMYASAARNLKKKWNDPNTATPYEDTTVRELIVETESGQDCLLMKVVDLDKEVFGKGTEETSNESTETTVEEEKVEETKNTNTVSTKTKTIKKVQPLTGTNKKIDTNYLKTWIEQTIDESKVLTGSYKVTMKRTYKASKLNNPNNKNIEFKGLVNPKKYPTSVDYRGYNVKIDISGIVYENIVHIIASDQIIAGVGLESLGNPTADKVFENIFSKAQTNDPKFAGRPVGSLDDTIIHTILVIQTNDKKTTRIVPTDLLPSEKTALEEVIGQENPDYPDRVVYAVNTRYTNEWQDDAFIVGAMFAYLDGRFETVGEVNIKTPTVDTPTTDSTASETNDTNTTATVAQTTSAANVAASNLNCVVEIIENADNKKLIGTVNVTLTNDEWIEVKDAYRDAKEENESVFDRIYCDKLLDVVKNQLHLTKYGSYDFGNIVATDANGNQFKVENPWL